MKNETEFKEWLLDNISEMTEEIEQVSGESCPFCCQPSYPVNGKLEGYDDIKEAGLEPEEYHINHYNDCFLLMLDKYYLEIVTDGLWI